MSEVVVATRLALRPISQVMCIRHREGSAEPDKRAEINEHMLEPLRGRIGLMNQEAVHADRVAGA